MSAQKEGPPRPKYRFLVMNSEVRVLHYDVRTLKM